jgi:hypothetical protein
MPEGHGRSNRPGVDPHRIGAGTRGLTPWSFFEHYQSESHTVPRYQGVACGPVRLFLPSVPYQDYATGEGSFPVGKSATGS